MEREHPCIDMQRLNRNGFVLSVGDGGLRHWMRDHTVCVHAMALTRAAGHLPGVRRWLSYSCIREQASNDPDVKAIVAECQEWVVAASRHESVHGEGSMLNHEHPYALTLTGLRSEKTRISRSCQETATLACGDA